MFEERLRGLARWLAITFGEKVDGGDHDWEMRFETAHVHCAVPISHSGKPPYTLIPDPHKVSIAYCHPDDHRFWAVIYDNYPLESSIYKPELYEETLRVLEAETVLERMSNA